MTANSEKSNIKSHCEKESEILPPAKADWIKFGALEVQAKAKRMWQVVAIIAIVGLVVVTVTDGWLFMERQIRLEKISNQHENLKELNRRLSNKLVSVNDAIKQYNKAINMERDEKNLIAVEKGILQAQVELLMNEIATLEAQKRELESESEITIDENSDSVPQ